MYYLQSFKNICLEIVKTFLIILIQVLYFILSLWGFILTGFNKIQEYFSESRNPICRAFLVRVYNRYNQNTDRYNLFCTEGFFSESSPYLKIHMLKSWEFYIILPFVLLTQTLLFYFLFINVLDGWSISINIYFLLLNTIYVLGVTTKFSQIYLSMSSYIGGYIALLEDFEVKQLTCFLVNTLFDFLVLTLICINALNYTGMDSILNMTAYHFATELDEYLSAFLNITGNNPFHRFANFLEQQNLQVGLLNR